MKNEHPAFFLIQDDIVNSLNYEGIAIGVAVLPLSDDRLRIGITDRMIWMISSYGDQCTE